MRTEWAVLADAQRARIFARVGDGDWQDIRSLSRADERESDGREVRLPAGLKRLVDLVSAAPRDQSFSARLASELRVARKRGDFEALFLVAPAELLEELVAALDTATRRAIATTVSENLVGLPVREARRELARRF